MMVDCYILNDFSKNDAKMEEEFKVMYLASVIVDDAFNYFKIERKLSNVGKPPFDLKDIIKLIFYGRINKITSSIELTYNPIV